MNIKSIVDEYNEDKPKTGNQNNDTVDINEVYASLVLIQNAIQSLKLQANEYGERLDKYDEAQSIRFNNLDKTIAAVPVQTQRLTNNDVKNLISKVSSMEETATKICSSLQETMKKQNDIVERQLNVFQRQENAVNNLCNKINTYENYLIGIPFLYIFALAFIKWYFS